MLIVDNSEKGNSMFYAYSISLMYFLRAKMDQGIINRIFHKLSLNEEQKALLQALLSKDPSQEFTRDEITRTIEPILGRATRDLVAKKTKLEFKASPQDTFLFSSAKYRLEFYFKRALQDQDPYLASLIDPHSENLENEIYQNKGDKGSYIDMEVYATLRANSVSLNIERLKRSKRVIDKEKSFTEAEIAQILDFLLKKETVNYFLENDEKRLNQFITYLQKESTCGSSEYLFLLHRTIQGERLVRNERGTIELVYDQEILLHVHQDGSSPFEQLGSPEMILDNIGNTHWTSKIPETIFYPVRLKKEPPKAELNTKKPFFTEHEDKQKIQKYVVLGGGIAGTVLALELSEYLDKKNKELKLHGKEEKPYKITILEKRDCALAGSSDRTPCRLGLGFHYADYATASKYYRATLNLLKKYRARDIDLRLHMDPDDVPYDKAGNKMSDPLHRGRYCFVKDSVMPQEKVFAVFEKLKDLYREDCEILGDSGESPNKLFGDPNDFYTVLPKKKIDHIDSSIVNKDRVTAVVETAECILNWPLLKKTILEDIQSNKHIVLQTHADIQKITPKDNPLEGYKITFRNAEDSEESIFADVVVNATWESISYFNQQLGIAPQEITNRLKIMVAVDLPKSLQKEHCLFFCFGPHASFTNIGNGTGYITAEKYTNYLQSTDLIISPEMEKLLYGLPNSATHAEKKLLKTTKEEIAGKIIAEVTQYIPAMKDAKIKVNKYGELAIYSGIVRTPGIVKDLDSQTSCIHYRSESGVIGHKIAGLPNYFEDASYKLMYALNNAYELIELMQPALEELELLQSVIDDAMPQTPFTGEKAKGSTLTFDFFFNSSSCQSAPSKGARKELVKAVAPIILSNFFTEKEPHIDKIRETLEKTIKAKESLIASFKKSKKQETLHSSRISVVTP